MKYMTPKEAAEQWNITRRRVNVLCSEGRIKGAERHGGIWMIPASAEKPVDARLGQKRQTAAEKTLNKKKEIFLSLEHTVARPRLLDKIAPNGAKLTYIHADAGYGKTTLLMQYAKGCNNAIWISFDNRDNDPLFFLHHLEDSIREKLHPFDFHSIDYIPFVGSETFPPTVIAALLRAIGSSKLAVIMDDVHTLTNDTLIALLTEWVKDCPQSLLFIMASRHELWSGLFRLKMDSMVSELTKEDLCFSREEAEKLWGFFDAEAYSATEGWTLAIQSYRIAAESNKKLFVSSHNANRDLYRYLFNEIFMRLSAEVRFFLKATSFLPTLEASGCNRLLRIDNSEKILEELIRRNIFTLHISASSYRYHTLFRSFLQKNDDGSGRKTLHKAMTLSFDDGDYEQAADYALILKDGDMIQDCISAIQGKTFTGSRCRNLKKYFDFLEARSIELAPRVLLAKGIHFSDQGDFYEAEKYLSEAIPTFNSEDKMIYLHTMTHKARVLRNRVSFTESSRCIDGLLPMLENAPLQDWYGVMIEKIHNLTITSQLSDALELTLTMMEKCLTSGAPGIKAWFERYLTVIYFYMGDFKNCLKEYEKSLSIPEEELDWLMRHCVGAYAAKAYQLTGQEEKALPVLEAELERMRRLEFHEEFSIIYLIYADVLHAVELLKFYQGEAFDFSEAYRYLDMAEEYAVLNRSTRDHYLFAKIWKICAGLLLQPDKTEPFVEEALTLMKNATPFWQSLAYGRMANALNSLGRNPEQYKEFFSQCIKIGDTIGSYGYTPFAYGRMAAISLQEGDEDAAVQYTSRFLELSCKYNNRFYIRFKPLFATALKLATEHGVTPEYTREMLSYGGYTTERVYINTLGRFFAAPAYNRENPVKIRTQKSRELLAYLLEQRKGVAREQIYADLWGDSEADVTRLFHTRRGEIRQAFESLGAGNPILYENGLYRLNLDEIVCDHDSFRQAVDEFRRKSSPENAEKVVALYTGRYLDDLEALWAEGTRLQSEDSFLEAAEVLLGSYRDLGQRAKSIELLRRCTGLRQLI